MSPRPFRVTSFLFRLRPFHLISFLLEFGRSETKCFKKGFRAVSTLVAPCVPLGLLSYYSSLLRRRRRDLFVVSSLTCPVAGSKDPPDDAPDDPPDETPKTARNGPDPFRAPKPPKLIILIPGRPTESGGLRNRRIRPSAGPPLGLPNRASIWELLFFTSRSPTATTRGVTRRDPR